ncbi:hypothetical protein ES703_124481 [subsurface metagenome]
MHIPSKEAVTPESLPVQLFPTNTLFEQLSRKIPCCTFSLQVFPVSVLLSLDESRLMPLRVFPWQVFPVNVLLLIPDMNMPRCTFSLQVFPVNVLLSLDWYI